MGRNAAVKACRRGIREAHARLGWVAPPHGTERVGRHSRRHVGIVYCGGGTYARRLRQTTIVTIGAWCPDCMESPIRFGNPVWNVANVPRNRAQRRALQAAARRGDGQVEVWGTHNGRPATFGVRERCPVHALLPGSPVGGALW